MLGEDILWNDLPPQQVILNDLLQHWGRAGVIPRSLRIDHRNRPVLADSQAVRLASQDQGPGSRQAHFLEPAFQKLPRLQSFRPRAAQRLGRIRAEENVALAGFQTQRLGEIGEIGHDPL